MKELIFPVWKEIGESTHVLTKVISDQIGEVCAHTGTLDPMASGVVVVLGGLTRFDKSRYSDGAKKYEVEVVVGVSTDTEDLMGLVRHISPETVALSDLHQSESLKIGHQLQIPHVFSALRTKDAHRKVTLHSIDIMFGDAITRHQLMATCKSNIGSVQGDFRQAQILNRWAQCQDELSETLPTLRLKLTTSRGFYVRSLIRDLGYELNIPLVILALTRVENAGFKKGDCVRDKLEQHVRLASTSREPIGNHN